ncbi:TRAP transporter small permease [Oceanobacillus senegalensis]|uniref:TRAP transporter small permease n=1 Tax=Oceanobacillus senegalensis TaxID=1936063 RepID=UPI001FEA9FF6|nr:TRAP transporter small permease [Oceanobacillus senegalensis]
MLNKVIHGLTTLTRYIALTTMTLMMLFITVAVVSRLFFSPVIGDVEIVQLGMVVLIMCGLAYTQQVGGHISIELVVNKFPEKVQQFCDIVANLFSLVVTLMIAYIYLEVAFNHKDHMQLSTNLLEIPYYPFDFIIVLGFLMWGLESLLKLIKSIIVIFSSQNE